MNGHIGDVGREEDPLLNGADSISAVWAFHGSDSDMLHLRDFMRFEDPAGPSHAGLDESSSCWASAGLELSQPLAPGGSDMASLMLPSFSCAEAHDRSMGLIEPVTSPFVAASSSVQLLPPPPPPPPPQQQQQQQPLSIESIPVYHRSASEELAAELGNRLDARILEFLSLMGVRDCRSLMTCAAQTALGQRETKRIDVKVTKALLELRANTVTMFGNRYFGSPVSSNTIMCNLLVESLESKPRRPPKSAHAATLAVIFQAAWASKPFSEAHELLESGRGIGAFWPSLAQTIQRILWQLLAMAPRLLLLLAGIPL
eukprot:CAMPEP_0177614564 /NCGR_PEP_ID=MMETSP0419_2-20121207/22791_1 /TAXON_ID=582737 /ORGANISM="Tetraselmis sp., Strain GSL018" /LENGTH=314 /DNA_ID=CAMNT_0019111767 /DNA_START=464 /DNA_END=1409 /DNA_ORIENTATION=-